MIEQFALRSLRIVALAAVIAGLGACTMVLLPPNITPVVTPSTSVDEADRRLEEVGVQRAAAEAEFAASEQVCYTKFFVNSCLDDAKEKRRSILANLRAMEVEAEYFKRKAAVELRDREVEQAVKQFEAGEAAAAAAPAPEPKAPPVRKKPVAPKATLAERRAAQEAKLARHAAQEQAQAPVRAAKAKEFEERRLESIERQKAVEKKKAEKAAKAAAPAK